MKKYPQLGESVRIQKVQQQLNELELFQYQLRNCTNFNHEFHDKAFEIADGLQPWIDALKITLIE